MRTVRSERVLVGSEPAEAATRQRIRTVSQPTALLRHHTTVR